MHGSDLADGNGEQIPSAVQDAGPVGAVLCSLFGPPPMVTGGAADDDGDGDGRGSGRGGGDGHGCLASSSEASASRALAKFTMSLSEPSGSRNRYMPDQRSSTTIRGFRVTLRRRVATIPGADFIALRAFLRAVAALQAAVEDLCAAVRQRVLQKRALERRGVKDAPQEAQKLLRSRARLPIIPMQSISPLRPRFAPWPFSFRAQICCYGGSQSGLRRGFTLGEKALEPLAGNS